MEISLEWILLTVAVIGIAIGLFGFGMKKDAGKALTIGGLVVAAIVIISAGGLPEAPLAVPGVDVPSVTPMEDVSICAVTGPLVYAQLNYTGDTWRSSGANSPTGPAGSVEFFADGTDLSIPGVTALDTISVTAGVGATTSKILKSCTDYEIVYNGASAEYDIMHPTGRIAPVKTDIGEIPSQTIEFHNVKVFATIGDLVEENAVDGTINGQTSTSGEANSTLELTVGTDSSPADGDTIYYNKTNGDDVFYIDIDMEATGGDKVLKNPALCFVNLANPMEGTEFSEVTLTYRSGTNFGIPDSITDYVKYQRCVPLSDEMTSTDSGTYRLQFTVVDANADVTADVMYVYLDDLGEHLGRDIRDNTKATAAGFTLQFEE